MPTQKHCSATRAIQLTTSTVALVETHATRESAADMAARYMAQLPDDKLCDDGWIKRNHAPTMRHFRRSLWLSPSTFLSQKWCCQLRARATKNVSSEFEVSFIRPFFFGFAIKNGMVRDGYGRQHLNLRSICHAVLLGGGGTA